MKKILILLLMLLLLCSMAVYTTAATSEEIKNKFRDGATRYPSTEAEFKEAETYLIGLETFNDWEYRLAGYFILNICQGTRLVREPNELLIGEKHFNQFIEEEGYFSIKGPFETAMASSGVSIVAQSEDTKQTPDEIDKQASERPYIREVYLTKDEMKRIKKNTFITGILIDEKGFIRFNTSFGIIKSLGCSAGLGLSGCFGARDDGTIMASGELVFDGIKITAPDPKKDTSASDCRIKLTPDGKIEADACRIEFTNGFIPAGDPVNDIPNSEVRINLNDGTVGFASSQRAAFVHPESGIAFKRIHDLKLDGSKVSEVWASDLENNNPENMLPSKMSGGQYIKTTFEQDGGIDFYTEGNVWIDGLKLPEYSQDEMVLSVLASDTHMHFSDSSKPVDYISVKRLDHKGMVENVKLLMKDDHDKTTQSAVVRSTDFYYNPHGLLEGVKQSDAFQFQLKKKFGVYEGPGNVNDIQALKTENGIDVYLHDDEPEELETSEDKPSMNIYTIDGGYQAGGSSVWTAEGKGANIENIFTLPNDGAIVKYIHEKGRGHPLVDIDIIAKRMINPNSIAYDGKWFQVDGNGYIKYVKPGFWKRFTHFFDNTKSDFLVDINNEAIGKLDSYTINFKKGPVKTSSKSSVTIKESSEEQEVQPVKQAPTGETTE